MSIYDVSGDLGDKLYEVLHRLNQVIVAMETIDQAEWSDHMDELHKRVSHIIRVWEYVQLKEEE